MPLPKIEDARKLNDQELAEAIVTAKRELFDLRFQKATRRLEKPHQFKHLKHRIAQMMTVARERELAAMEEASETSATAAEPVAATPEATASEEQTTTSATAEPSEAEPASAETEATETPQSESDTTQEE
jgi:large subunit ribosomal protein L29